MKKLTNTETGLKKTVAYKKSVYYPENFAFLILRIVELFMNFYSDKYSKHRFIFRHRFEKNSCYP